jgi:hypothetical protein
MPSDRSWIEQVNSINEPKKRESPSPFESEFYSDEEITTSVFADTLDGLTVRVGRGPNVSAPCLQTQVADQAWRSPRGAVAQRAERLGAQVR